MTVRQMLPMKTIAREPAEILLIDDDPQTLKGATAALEGAGHIVFQASDQAMALSVARAHALDLVISNIQLGGGSGLDLCRELRGLPGMQDVPCMFVSSTQLPDIIRRSHDAGAAYYLRKPLDPDVLLDLVSKALWLPHLVQTRLARRDRQPDLVTTESPRRPVQPPHKKSAIRAAAVQGIRLPLA